MTNTVSLSARFVAPEDAIWAEFTTPIVALSRKFSGTLLTSIRQADRVHRVSQRCKKKETASARETLHDQGGRRRVGHVPACHHQPRRTPPGPLRGRVLWDAIPDAAVHSRGCRQAPAARRRVEW